MTSYLKNTNYGDYGDPRNSTNMYQNPLDNLPTDNLPNHETRKDEVTYVPVTYSYVMKDVEAFKSKDFIASVDDYLIKLDFQLSKMIIPKLKEKDLTLTWNEVNKYIIEHKDCGEYLEESQKYAAKALDKELDITGLDQKQISKKVISFVKNNFQWNEEESVLASQEAKEFYKNRVGNNADINLFLIALLKEAGIDASPVISSTRDNGKSL